MNARDASLKKYRPAVLSAVMLLTAVVSSACSMRGVELRFSTIEQREEAGTGEYFEDSTARIIFISTPEDIAQVEGKVTPDAILRLEGIDFENAFALLVTMGRRNSTGQAVNIRRLVRQGNQVDILVTFVEPGPAPSVSGVETSPYHLVEVQKQGGFGREMKFTLYASLVVEQNLFIP